MRTAVPPAGLDSIAQRTAVRLDDPPRGGQAETGAAMFRREEGLEHSLAQLDRDAGSAVGDDEIDQAIVPVADRDRDRPRWSIACAALRIRLVMATRS